MLNTGERKVEKWFNHLFEVDMFIFKASTDFSPLPLDLFDLALLTFQCSHLFREDVTHIFVLEIKIFSK